MCYFSFPHISHTFLETHQLYPCQPDGDNLKTLPDQPDHPSFPKTMINFVSEKHCPVNSAEMSLAPGLQVRFYLLLTFSFCFTFLFDVQFVCFPWSALINKQ